MSEPFLAEIKMVGFNFPPRGWAGCDGQILPINQNQALYSLLGTTYGGDGRTTFALPDLRGRVPRHVDSSNNLGSKTGEETHSLTPAEIPPHSHGRQASAGAANLTSPADALHAVTGGGRRPVTPYTAGTNLTNMQPTASAGGGQGHDNMQPFTTLNFVIALQGLFPSRK